MAPFPIPRPPSQAVVDTEFQLVGAAGWAAGVVQLLVLRRPGAGLGVAGGLLGLSFFVPPHGLALLFAVAVLAALQPLPADELQEVRCGLSGAHSRGKGTPKGLCSGSKAAETVFGGYTSGCPLEQLLGSGAVEALAE